MDGHQITVMILLLDTTVARTIIVRPFMSIVVRVYAVTDNIVTRYLLEVLFLVMHKSTESHFVEVEVANDTRVSKIILGESLSTLMKMADNLGVVIVLVVFIERDPHLAAVSM